MYDSTYKSYKIGNNYWSMETAVLDTYERTLYKLQTLLVQKRVHTTSKIKKMIEKMIKPWEFRIQREGKSDIDRIYLRNLTGMNPENWRKLKSGEETLNKIIEQLKKNHKLNQGRLRKERMKQLKKKKGELEKESDQGRPGRLNTDIMGQKKGKVIIPIDNVIEKLSILTDEQEVHHSLTRSFEESFARQEQYNEGFMKENVDIDSLLEKENFMEAYASKGIEDEYVELIYDAIIRPMDDMEQHAKQSEEIRISLEKCPTMEELNKAIEKSKKNKSGGSTGLTYNMLKLASREIIEDIYKELVRMWENNLEIADFWQNRWLKAVSKGEYQITAESARPIMLIEVTRKLWMSILMRRIENHWRKYKVIDDSQHAYTGGSNTDSAISQLYAGLETAKNQYGTIALGSWDFKKAFDSPAKSILILAWTRAGIPKKFAEYIVGMDIGGKIIIKTEYALNLQRRKGYNGLMSMSGNEGKKHFFNRYINEYEAFKKYFEAIMGCGQGDNPSSLNWKAFIDILNRAMSIKAGNKCFNKAMENQTNCIC